MMGNLSRENTKPIKFTQITKTDLTTLIKLFQNNNDPKVTDTFTAFPLDEAAAKNIIDNEKDRFYFAFLNAKPVGFGMLRGWSEGYDISSLGLFIDKNHHGLGVGKKLTVFLMDEAKRFGCNKIRLSVYKCNKVAYELYKKLGFVESEIFDKYVIMLYSIL